MIGQIFDRLTDQDETQRLKPGLALSWRVLDDTTWEFKLRPGVKFTDGSELTANDVIYTFCRAPRVENSPSSFAIYSRAITAMTAPDPLTLVMKTAGPYPLLPNEVATIAILSVNLGLINLFPIPVLDGGHLLFYAAEAIRGRPLGPRAQEYGFRLGLALVLTLMVFATWNDLVQLQVVKFLKNLVT